MFLRHLKFLQDIPLNNENLMMQLLDLKYFKLTESLSHFHFAYLQ